MAKTPRLTVRCEYPDGSSPPSEVTFGLSPRYGIHTSREVHDWFLESILFAAKSACQVTVQAVAVACGVGNLVSKYAGLMKEFRARSSP